MPLPALCGNATIVHGCDRALVRARRVCKGRIGEMRMHVNVDFAGLQTRQGIGERKFR